MSWLPAPPCARGHPGWRHRNTVSHPAGHPLRVCWHRWGGRWGLGGSDPQPGSLWGSVALLGTCRVGATAPRPPGHAGEAPTQVLVAPKVKPPPHSHPGGGSGRPCHRCHQAPQADIYPCPGAAWQRASSARCYFRSRSLAAAPSPHCLAPRGAAGGSRAPQEPAEPPLATLVLSREAEDAVGIRRSNFPWRREELAGSELLGTSHAAGGLSASLEPALRARLGSPAGDIGCTRPGTDLGAEQGRREPGGLGAHRGSWFLPCPLALSLGSRN